MKGHHGNQSINTKQHNKRQHSCCSQSPNETTTLQIEPCESPNETLISKKNNHKEQEGKIRSDSCQKAAWFMMGVGFLFPYNSVVTAIDFFAAIYFPSIDFALGWLLLAPSLLILCTVLGNNCMYILYRNLHGNDMQSPHQNVHALIPQQGITLKFGYWGSIYHRVIVTLLLSSVLTIAIPLLRNPYILFPCVFALGCLTAVLQGTLFSLLGFLGSDLMSITQTGIGCSGVMVGVVRVMTKYFEPDQLALSTYLYFGIAFVMVMIDIAVYVMVLHPSKRVQDAVHLDTLKNEALHGNLHEMKRTLSRTFSRSPSKRNSPRRVMQNTHCHESSSMLDDGRKRDRYKSVSLSQLSVDSGEYKGSISPRRVMKDTHSVSMSLSALFCVISIGVSRHCHFLHL